MYVSWSVSAISANKFGDHCWTKIITVTSLTEQQTISLSSKSKENGEKRLGKALSFPLLCTYPNKEVTEIISIERKRNIF